MDKSKLKARDVQILLIIMGIIVLFVSYKFVYTKFSDKADKIEKEVTTLKSEKSELEAHASKISQYEDDIKNYTKYSQDFFKKIPKKITMDSSIQFLINFWKDYAISIDSINLGDPALFYTITDNGGIPVKDGASKGTSTDADTKTNGEVYAVQVSIAYKTSYETLKKALKNITNNDNVLVTIESIDMSYSSDTGQISGNAVLTAYSTSYELGRDYSDPDFGLDLGVGDLFGTF